MSSKKKTSKKTKSKKTTSESKDKHITQPKVLEKKDRTESIKNKNDNLEENPDENEDLDEEIGTISDDKSESLEEEKEASNERDEDENDESYSQFLEEMKSKKNSKANFEELYDQETDEEEYASLYTFCKECNEYIYVYYRKSLITNAKSYPVYIVWVHGTPNHGVLVRIDKNFTSRGERMVSVEYDQSLYSE